MKEEKKILLIHKVITGVATQEEQKMFDDMRKLSSDNVKLINDISFIWELSKSDHKQIDTNKAKTRLFNKINEEKHENENSLKVRRLDMRKLMSIAAMFLVLIAAIFVFRQYQESRVESELEVAGNFGFLPGYGNESNTVKMYKLSDMTKVWADPDAKLSVLSDNSNDRLVKLEGNAFFEVSKDREHPFTVEVNEFNIRVLGTSFQIFSDDSSVEVNVYSGVVEFSNRNKKVILKKDEGAVYTNTSGSFIKIGKEDFKTNTKNAYLIFNNSNLKTVLTKLSRYFDIKINYDCASIETLDGFTSPQYAGDNIEFYFSTIEKLYNLSFHKMENGEYKVSCD